MIDAQAARCLEPSRASRRSYRAALLRGAGGGASRRYRDGTHAAASHHNCQGPNRTPNRPDAAPGSACPPPAPGLASRTTMLAAPRWRPAATIWPPRATRGNVQLPPRDPAPRAARRLGFRRLGYRHRELSSPAIPPDAAVPASDAPPPRRPPGPGSLSQMIPAFMRFQEQCPGTFVGCAPVPEGDHYQGEHPNMRHQRHERTPGRPLLCCSKRNGTSAGCVPSSGLNRCPCRESVVRSSSLSATSSITKTQGGR